MSDSARMDEQSLCENRGTPGTNWHLGSCLSSNKQCNHGKAMTAWIEEETQGVLCSSRNARYSKWQVGLEHCNVTCSQDHPDIHYLTAQPSHTVICANLKAPFKVSGMLSAAFAEPNGRILLHVAVRSRMGAQPKVIELDRMTS